MREAHWLTRTGSSKYPRKIIYVYSTAIETAEKNPPPDRWQQWQASSAVIDYYGDAGNCRSAPMDITTPERFWQIVESAAGYRYQTWIYCHNLGREMTLLGLWPKLTQRWARVERYVIAEPPCYLYLRLGMRSIVISDVMNYWPQPIHELVLDGAGRDAELPPMPDRDITAHDAAYIGCHAIRDSVHSLLSQVRSGELCTWHPTAAAMAFSAYRRHFLPTLETAELARAPQRLTGQSHRVQPVLHIHDNADATAMEREAYVGGRVQCMYIGSAPGPIYHLDVNSMYASIMAENTFPCQLIERIKPDGWAEIIAGSCAGDCIARITIDNADKDYPYQIGLSDKYASGSYETVLSGPELCDAVRNGYVGRCIEGYQYRTANLFSDYVEFFYSARLKFRECGDKNGERFAKLMLVSLFGKFGQQSRQWKEADDIAPMLAWGEWTQQDNTSSPAYRCRAMAWTVQRLMKGEEWIHSFPAISAWVTSYGRLHMSQLIGIAGPRQVYYSDTDSLHVTQLGLDRLKKWQPLSDTRLGSLRLKETYDTVTYYGPRDYIAGGQRLLAGVSSGANSLDNGVFVEKRQRSLKQHLTGNPGDRVAIYERRVQMARNQYAGRLDAEGRVKPYVV